jgi:hypothetical protein
LVHHRINRDLYFEHLTLCVDLDSLGQVAHCDRAGDLRNRAHLIRYIARHFLHGEISNSSGIALNKDKITEEDKTHVQVDDQIEHLRDTGDLFCKLNEFINHSIDDIPDLDHEGTLHGDGDPMGQVTVGDGITDTNDVAETKLVYCTLVGFKCGI